MATIDIATLDPAATVVVATGNAHKLTEIEAILSTAPALEGVRFVALGDLGDFHCELATKGAKTTEDFNASYIEAVNVRWTPGNGFQNLRSEATFQLVPGREAQADAIEVIRNEDTIQGLE